MLETNDGRISTVIDAARRPSALGRAFQFLLGWLPATGLVRWLVQKLLHWLALGATPGQLSACIQVCTGSLALAELRLEVEKACADGECSVEVREQLERTVCQVEARLEGAVEAVITQLDENFDGRLTLNEALGLLQGRYGGPGSSPAGRGQSSGSTSSVAAVLDAARNGQRLVADARRTADEAFEVVDTTNDGKISLQEAIAAPRLLLEWWQRRQSRAGS